MLNVLSASGQTSFGLNGMYGVSEESFTSLNSYEYNISNYSVVKDWGFSFTYGVEFASSVTSNLYQITAAKTFGSHFISLRYTPGYQKEFVFQSGEAIPYNNTEPINLESRFLFKELFGAGYSYRINSDLSIGFNVRYFKQDFTNENVSAIFSDTIYFVRETEEDNSELWKTDIGLVWKPLDRLVINLGSINLFTFTSKPANEENSEFELRTNKALLAGI